MNLEKYQKLLKKAEELRSQADRADGKLQQLKEQLKKEFGCNTIKEARTKFKKLDAEYKQATKAADEAMEKFEQEFGDRL